MWFVHVCASACMCRCLCACVHKCMQVCVCVCMCVCVCVCVHACMIALGLSAKQLQIHTSTTCLCDFKLHICDTLPRKVHKVTGSERRYTPEQVVWPNFVDFKLINFSVTLATHSPPLNIWALIFIEKWLKSVIFRLAVDLNAAYFTQKHTVFKRCGRWSHCDKGHVWRINGNLVFPRFLSLPLNERSLFPSRVNRLQIW